MKIPEKFQTEVVKYLTKDLNQLSKVVVLKNDSSKNDIISRSIAKGVHLGMSRAIEVIKNWNVQEEVPVNVKSIEKKVSDKESKRIFDNYQKLINSVKTENDEFECGNV